MHPKNDRRLLAKDGICLVTHPDIALTLGKSEAIFLQQLHYWLTTETNIGTVLDGQRWIYNSYRSWVDNLQIYSESTIRRAVCKLEGLGIVVTKNLNKKKSDHTKWYTINYDALKDMIPGLSTKPRGGEGNQKARGGCLLKMNRPSVQNEQIINKENRDYFREEISTGETEVTTQPHQAPLEKDIFQKMISIWNEIVEEGKRTLELNQKRARFLITAFKTKFEESLEKWRAFCKRVASSKFLMGEIKSSFRASLDWVLKFDIIQRILEGDFGIGDRVVYVRDNQNTSQQLQVEITDSGEPKPIQHIRQYLLKQVGQGAYASWFKDTSITLEEGGVIIKTSSSFAKDSINRLFLSDIEKVCQQIGQGGDVTVE